jgi:hypothetical protein
MEDAHVRRIRRRRAMHDFAYYLALLERIVSGRRGDPVA